MKKARIINGTAWAVIGVALVVMVCYYWHQMGCGWESLAAAIFQYSAFAACFGFCGDQWIKEHYQNQ